MSTGVNTGMNTARLIRAGVAGAMLLLAGCGDLLPRGVGATGPRAESDRAGRPLLLARVPRLGTQARMRPSGRNGDVITWEAPDAVSVSLAGGVLVATRGLGPDLMSAEVTQTRAMLAGAPMPARGYARLHSYLDGEHRVQFESFLCRDAGRRPETVTLRGMTRQTLRVTEICTSPDTDFVNEYWIGADGVVWRSRQWIGPRLGYLETSRLRR